VGLIQRAVEASGIPTVSVSVLREITARVRPPRAVFVRWPFGHPLGEPGNRVQQLVVIRDALEALYTASPGTIVDLPYRWRREQYTEPAEWDLGPTRSGGRAEGRVPETPPRGG